MDTSTSTEIKMETTAVWPSVPSTLPKKSISPRKKRRRKSISLNTRLSVAQSALAQLRGLGIDVFVEEINGGMILRLSGRVTLCKARLHLISTEPCPNCEKEK